MAGSLHSPDRRLLAEGWFESWAEGSEHLVSVPRAIYVVQDDKVWFARGDSTLIGESLSALLESEGTTRTIVESVDDLALEERKLADGSTIKLPKGPWIIEGVFQRSDVPNANKRVYPRGLWERTIADPKSYAQTMIRERGMLGHLEHPKDGRTDGKEGALVVTEAKLLQDGTVWGKAEILDTPNGLILKEYTRKGIRWGVSSRGNGTVADNGQVDEASFVLETWDAVMRPSVPGAYPTMGQSRVAEGTQQEHSEGTALGGVTESEQLASAVTSLVETPIDQIGDSASRVGTLRSLRSLVERVSLLQGEVDRNISFQVFLDLQSKLAQFAVDLGESFMESATDPVDTAVDRAIARAAEIEGDERVDGFDRVMESLKRKLMDAHAEIDDLRGQLGEVESRSDRAHEQLDGSLEQLSEVEVELRSTRVQLELAEELLAERQGSESSEAIQEAADTIIADLPGMGAFRNVLLLAKSVEAVDTVAEALLPVVVARRTADEKKLTESKVKAPSTSGRANRTTLPTALPVESDPDAGDTTRLIEHQEIPGVSVARRALATMRPLHG